MVSKVLICPCYAFWKGNVTTLPLENLPVPGQADLLYAGGYSAEDCQLLAIMC